MLSGTSSRGYTDMEFSCTYGKVLPPNPHPYATANIITGEGFDSIIGSGGRLVRPDPWLYMLYVLEYHSGRDPQHSSGSTPVYPTPRINQIMTLMKDTCTSYPNIRTKCRGLALRVFTWGENLQGVQYRGYPNFKLSWHDAIKTP